MRVILDKGPLIVLLFRKTVWVRPFGITSWPMGAATLWDPWDASPPLEVVGKGMDETWMEP